MRDPLRSKVGRRRLRAAAFVAATILGAAACARITGSGNVLTKPISVPAFSKLQVGSAFDVTVSVGTQQAVTLHVDDNVVAHVDVGVSGGTLRIRLKPRVSVSDATLKADVTTPSLTSVELTGAGRVHLPSDFPASSLSVTESGASVLDGSLRGDQAKLSLSGASSATLSGNVMHLIVDGRWASRLEALDLQLADLEISLAGASQATVSVSGTLSAEVSGASTLRYRGSPRFSKKETSGASSIEQV